MVHDRLSPKEEAILKSQLGKANYLALKAVAYGNKPVAGDFPSVAILPKIARKLGLT